MLRLLYPNGIGYGRYIRDHTKGQYFALVDRIPTGWPQDQVDLLRPLLHGPWLLDECVVEYPEVALSEVDQIAIADDLLRASMGTTVTVITESELILRRVLRRVRRGEFPLADLEVVVLVRPDHGWPMKIDQDGDFIDCWPGGYFEGSFRELFDVDEIAPLEVNHVG